MNVLFESKTKNFTIQIIFGFGGGLSVQGIGLNVIRPTKKDIQRVANRQYNARDISAALELLTVYLKKWPVNETRIYDVVGDILDIPMDTTAFKSFPEPERSFLYEQYARIQKEGKIPKKLASKLIEIYA